MVIGRIAMGTTENASQTRLANLCDVFASVTAD